jgi:hypothetical protein
VQCLFSGFTFLSFGKSHHATTSDLPAAAPCLPLSMNLFSPNSKHHFEADWGVGEIQRVAVVL